MPHYHFKCEHCEFDRELFMKLKEYETFNKVCPECGEKSLQQIIDSPPGFVIPSNCTHDGIRKTNFTTHKQVPIVPINLVDQHPDGSYTVHRIGKKSDIENE